MNFKKILMTTCITLQISTLLHADDLKWANAIYAFADAVGNKVHTTLQAAATTIFNKRGATTNSQPKMDAIAKSLADGMEAQSIAAYLVPTFLAGRFTLGKPGEASTTIGKAMNGKLHDPKLITPANNATTTQQTSQIITTANTTPTSSKQQGSAPANTTPAPTNTTPSTQQVSTPASTNKGRSKQQGAATASTTTPQPTTPIIPATDTKKAKNPDKVPLITSVRNRAIYDKKQEQLTSQQSTPSTTTGAATDTKKAKNPDKVPLITSLKNRAIYDKKQAQLTSQPLQS